MRPAVGPWEELLDRLLPYVAIAERWHWPPSVVDGESIIRMRGMLAIAEVIDEVKEANAGRRRDVIVVEQQMG